MRRRIAFRFSDRLPGRADLGALPNAGCVPGGRQGVAAVLEARRVATVDVRAGGVMRLWLIIALAVAGPLLLSWLLHGGLVHP